MKAVRPKNSKTIILTGTITDIKLWASKIITREGVKVTCRRLVSYKGKPIYRVWIT